MHYSHKTEITLAHGGAASLQHLCTFALQSETKGEDRKASILFKLIWNEQDHNMLLLVIIKTVHTSHVVPPFKHEHTINTLISLEILFPFM